MTMRDGSALPGVARCSRCGAENPFGMNFCRNCGNPIMNSGRIPAMQGGVREPRPGQPAAPPVAASGPGSGAEAQSTCPHCGARTPSGFAFCQQCGRKMAAGSNIGPGTARNQGVVSGETNVPVDAIAPTVAAGDSEDLARLRQRAGTAQAGSSPSAKPLTPPVVVSMPGTAWGCLVSVNKDGSDGSVHPLSGEWVVIGRSAVDIAFGDDRFLAREHVRLEHGPVGCTAVPLDSLNGVYLRVVRDIWLDDGAILLLGREVVRFELVDEDERYAETLVRHGVAMFGSPPRQPWGRLVEIMAHGGALDVRHLWLDTVTIGREDGDIVFPDDAFLSRRHASLSLHDGRCKLTDLDSSNGTFVRLRGKTPLRPGDHLRIGDQLVRFELAR